MKRGEMLIFLGFVLLAHKGVGTEKYAATFLDVPIMNLGAIARLISAVSVQNDFYSKNELINSYIGRELNMSGEDIEQLLSMKFVEVQKQMEILSDLSNNMSDWKMSTSDHSEQNAFVQLLKEDEYFLEREVSLRVETSAMVNIKKTVLQEIEHLKSTLSYSIFQNILMGIDNLQSKNFDSNLKNDTIKEIKSNFTECEKRKCWNITDEVEQRLKIIENLEIARVNNQIKYRFRVGYLASQFIKIFNNPNRFDTFAKPSEILNVVKGLHEEKFKKFLRDFNDISTILSYLSNNTDKDFLKSRELRNFTQLEIDLSSDWIQRLIAQNNGTNNVKRALKPIVQFHKKLESIVKKWMMLRMQLPSFQSSLYMQRIPLAAEVGKKLFETENVKNKVDAIFGCYQSARQSSMNESEIKRNLENLVKLHSWLDEMSRYTNILIATVKQSMSQDFNESLKTVKTKYDRIGDALMEQGDADVLHEHLTSIVETLWSLPPSLFEYPFKNESYIEQDIVIPDHIVKFMKCVHRSSFSTFFEIIRLLEPITLFTNRQLFATVSGIMGDFATICEEWREMSSSILNSSEIVMVKRLRNISGIRDVASQVERAVQEIRELQILLRHKHEWIEQLTNKSLTALNVFLKDDLATLEKKLQRNPYINLKDLWTVFVEASKLREFELAFKSTSNIGTPPLEGWQPIMIREMSELSAFAEVQGILQMIFRQEYDEDPKKKSTTEQRHSLSHLKLSLLWSFFEANFNVFLMIFGVIGVPIIQWLWLNRHFFRSH